MPAIPECPRCHGTGLIPSPAQDGPWAHSGLASCDCPGGPGGPRGSWAGNQHRLTLARACGMTAWVDEGIAAEVELLWAHGIATTSSCQGDWRGLAWIKMSPRSRADEAAELTGFAHTEDYPDRDQARLERKVSGPQ